MKSKVMIAAHFIFLLLFVSVQISAQITEGSLIRGSKDAVYLYESGKARWISSDNIFKLLGFDYKNVKKISDTQLNKLPKGWLIVRGFGNPVYIINYGTPLKVSDWNILMKLGFEKTNIRQVQEEKLKKIPQQPLLVKGSGAPIYLINGEKACWIQSEKILKAMGWDIKTAVAVSDDALNKFPKTQFLVRGGGDKVYLVDREKKFWISNAELFNRLGYDWNAVLTVSDAQLNKIPEGVPIK